MRDDVGVHLGQVGQVLAREQQRAGAVLLHQRHRPGHRGLGGVGRAPDVQARDQAQAGGVFHRLVGGAVFAQADGVMREHVDDAALHQRGHADRVAAVVAEREEGAAVGDVAAVQRDAVHDRGHAELAHAVVDVAADLAVGQHHRAVLAEAQLGRALGVGQVGAGQVGRAAQHFRQRGGERFQRDLAGLAAGDGLGLVVRGGHRIGGDLGEVGRQLADHAAMQFLGQVGEGGLVGVERGGPLGFELRAGGLGVPGAVDVGRHFERRVIPAEGLARQRDLVGAQRLAVRLGGAGAIGRALADDGLADDQRRARGALACLRDGGIDGVNAVAVDLVDHVPAVGLEARLDVVDVPGGDLAVDGDAVVVVQADQLVQLPRAGERAGFVADAFHHAAVAHEDVRAVIDHGMAGAVEFGGEQLLGQRHADSVRQALAQRAGGGLDARRHVHFRMARGAAVQLAEVLQLLDGQVIAGEVQQRVLQHRAVAVGQHEAIAVVPQRVGRVVLEVTAPQGHGDVGHAHGRARVPGVGRLDGVHGERADRGGHQGGHRVDGGGGDDVRNLGHGRLFLGRKAAGRNRRF